VDIRNVIVTSGHGPAILQHRAALYHHVALYHRVIIAWLYITRVAWQVFYKSKQTASVPALRVGPSRDFYNSQIRGKIAGFALYDVTPPGS